MFEHCVAVGVEGHGHIEILHQPADQQEIAVGILLITEPGVHHPARGVVHRDQQRERWGQVSQPRVIAAVHLDQHPLSRHPLPTDPVFWWSTLPGTAQPSAQQDPSQGGPANVDTFPFRQQLRQMGVVDARVPGAGQMHHVGNDRFRGGVCRWAATVAMGQSLRPALTIGRQDAPGVSRGHSHQLGCLVQGHVLC